MLAAVSDVKGSAGYVAMERVTGKLHGRSGTFVLQHSGTMNRGSASLIVTVVALPHRKVTQTLANAGVSEHLWLERRASASYLIQIPHRYRWCATGQLGMQY